eukprot:TRINITY_DN12295_c0_g1_i1.p1 TRINITY_DN12295_c0_g1~~TRINITY_DN12295_c0_g1_i1.p1  ORF type:complete len:369 (+),score=145.94 TRINITY_DN12295_c0_g1_i1:350-1456(+)
MRRDYITAVEHALFHIALRLPRSCGVMFPGAASGNHFQTVPGFPQASYTDYAPEVFSEIQALYQVASRDYQRSICRLETIGHAGGSGVRMLLTHDRLYIVKQITPKERDTLLRMLERYYKHIQASIGAQGMPTAVIAPIFGCHAVRMASTGTCRTILLVVMANVDAAGQRVGTPAHNVVCKVDLKGSWINREERPTEFLSEVLRNRTAGSDSAPWAAKDIDLVRTCMRLTAAEWRSVFTLPSCFEERLHQDAAFLASEGIMDYSLLAVIFTSGPTQYAVVDYLQAWDAPKRWERFAKGLSSGVSAVAPDFYARRFTRNLTRLLCNRKPFVTGSQAGARLGDTDYIANRTFTDSIRLETDEVPLLLLQH